MSPIQSLVEAHAEHLRARNYSPISLRNRAAHLRQFLRFLKGKRIRNSQEVSAAVLREYPFWLHRLPTQRGGLRSPATLNRGLSAVKVFCRFLHETGCIATNPAKALVYAREPQQLPKTVLSPEEAKHIIESVDASTVAGYRDRTMLEILYATGIRKSELIHLAVADLNLEDQLLTVRCGKGGRDRVVPLGALACRFLANYLRVIRPALLNGSASDRVFFSRAGRPMGATTVSTMVDKHARLAGVRKHVTCHLWRHTCATHLVQNGANLRHVQEILGHHNLATTERYLHLTITDLKQALRKHHPREKEVAVRRAVGHNAGRASAGVSTSCSPAGAQNRALLSQPGPPSPPHSNQIQTAQERCI